MTDRIDSRAPKQARAAWTRERLLDVFSELLADRPLEDVRLADVASRAGVTLGAIYGRFDGKNEMVVAAYLRYSDDAVKRMESWAEDSRWATSTPRDIVASWVNGMRTFAGRRVQFVRLSAGSTDPKIIEGEQRIVACSAEKLAQLLRPFVPEESQAALQRRLGFAVMACHGMVVQRPSIAATGSLGFDDAQFGEALIDLVLGMVGIPSSNLTETGT
jgi:AcrR family transcriptional regulator